MGWLSLIRQIFGVMIGGQGAVSRRYTGGHAMNADQLKEKWMQFKTKLKQQWGKFTDEDLPRIEGNYETFVGKSPRTIC